MDDAREMPRGQAVNVEGAIDKPAGECTTVELLTMALARATGSADAFREDRATGREFSLAATHIEDAITRFNKGTYRSAGTFAISDAERQPAIAEAV